MSAPVPERLQVTGTANAVQTAKDRVVGDGRGHQFYSTACKSRRRRGNEEADAVASYHGIPVITWPGKSVKTRLPISPMTQ